VNTTLTIRILDILLSILGLLFLCPLMGCIFVLVWFDQGSPLFFQIRVGRCKAPFSLCKFRTMRVNTESVATHLVDISAVTRYGHFLRRTKLDELPQLWNVLKGEMSIVGPRPCLFNQEDLIGEREKRRVFDVRPGITGLAQIRGIDMSSPELLAKVDAEMLETLNLFEYCRIIFWTVIGRGT
jgi:O-antigen biosynthesis protein WbqP